MDTPTFEKKHSLPRNSDIPKHIWKVAEGGDSSDFSSRKYEPFFSKGSRSENILDPNEGCGR